MKKFKYTCPQCGVGLYDANAENRTEDSVALTPCYGCFIDNQNLSIYEDLLTKAFYYIDTIIDASKRNGKNDILKNIRNGFNNSIIEIDDFLHSTQVKS